MKLYVNVKQAGRRKNHITSEEIHLDFMPLTLRELIQAIVSENVRRFHSKNREKMILPYLTEEDIHEKISSGKLTFGEHYNDKDANLKDAIEDALVSYEDGIYRILIDDREAGALDDAIKLDEEAVLTFIRMTMLVGRLW